jgi:hypothetical protein
VLGISGIEPGEQIEGARDVLVTVGEGTAVTRVVFLVDGIQVSELTTPPYLFTFDPRTVADGSHAIRVVVETAGSPLETSVEFASAPPVAPSGGGPSFPPIFIVIAIAALAVVGAVILAYSKLRHRGSDITRLNVEQRTVPWAKQLAGKLREAPEMPLMHISEPEVEPEVVGEPLGVLISRAGPDLGSEYSVGAAPVSIGSGARCGVRIDDPEMAAEEARTWVRGGHLMVHRMTRLSVIAADGTSGGWMILEPGDSFTIGQHTYEFRMLDPQIQLPGASSEDDGPPSVLRTTLPSNLDC